MLYQVKKITHSQQQTTHLPGQHNFGRTVPVNESSNGAVEDVYATNEHSHSSKDHFVKAYYIIMYMIHTSEWPRIRS